MFEKYDIIEFFGKECPHCIKMHPLIEKLEKEEKLKILKLEVWHSPENQQILQQYSDVIAQACGGIIGVPVFYNNKTHEVLCGETDYQTLKEWALKEKEDTNLSYVS